MAERVEVPLAILGGGHMAQAIVRGGVRAGLLDAARVGVAEVDATRRAEAAGLGVQVFESARPALVWLAETESGGSGGQVLLAVKPQSLEGLAVEAKSALGAARRVVISILAGTPTARVRALLGPKAAIVRAMPNIAAQVGRGATAVCIGDGARKGDDRVARLLFGGIGRLVVPLEEPMMDAFTALAGSGPAYVFYLAEAMLRAAREMGFDDSTAMAVVRETIAGSGELMAASSASPIQLRAAVTSKGGTTAAATDVLKKGGVMDVVARAIVAARDRGRELSGRG